MNEEERTQVDDKPRSVQDLVTQLEENFAGWKREAMEKMRMELIEDAHAALEVIIVDGRGVGLMPFPEVTKTIKLLKSLIWALGHSPRLVNPDRREML